MHKPEKHKKHTIFLTTVVVISFFVFIIATFPSLFPSFFSRIDLSLTTREHLKILAQTEDKAKVTLQLPSRQITVEVVKKPLSIERGLSGRERIGSDGMLFILPQREIPQFWMKQMNFDLDFIWIDNLRVVEILPNVPRPLDPSCGLPNSECTLPTYAPKNPVTMMLEVEAGKAEEWGVQVGDVIEVIDQNQR